MKISAISSQVLLIILDGFGIRDESLKNAIHAAKTPNIDRYFSEYPFTTITPGGELVGLPKGVAGNSEVGHMNLGAGRPVRQDLVRINEAVSNNSLKDLPKFQELIDKTKKGTGRVHLMGLLSDGGVHSHIDHIKHLIPLLADEGLDIFFHAYMDGRDTSKTSGEKYITELLQTTGFVFASMQGRSIGMDRDRRWQKIEHAYKTLCGSGDITDKSPVDYLKSEYENENFDEFITPVLFGSRKNAIQDGDSVFFINFRPDRARQITLAMMDPQFSEFERNITPGYFLCMTPYVEEEIDLPILFNKEKIKGTLSEYLSRLGKKQLKIAETEKYAHVTYFFNGGERKPFDGESQILVPSPKDVATYDLKPEMSAKEVTTKLNIELQNRDYSFYLVNFANSDMVGHTGNYEAAVKAIEILDEQVDKIVKTALDNNISILITSDHGNSDQMIYEDGSPHTSHSSANSPFCLIAKDISKENVKINEGEFALKDVAPTILYLLGIEIPPEFTGKPIFS